jgi:hypothetical protein
MPLPIHLQPAKAQRTVMLTDKRLQFYLNDDMQLRLQATKRHVATVVLSQADTLKLANMLICHYKMICHAAKPYVFISKQGSYDRDD